MNQYSEELELIAQKVKDHAYMLPQGADHDDMLQFVDDVIQSCNTEVITDRFGIDEGDFYTYIMKPLGFKGGW